MNILAARLCSSTPQSLGRHDGDPALVTGQRGWISVILAEDNVGRVSPVTICLID